MIFQINQFFYQYWLELRMRVWVDQRLFVLSNLLHFKFIHFFIPLRSNFETIFSLSIKFNLDLNFRSLFDRIVVNNKKIVLK